jgi:hypothetical protein
MTAGSDSSLSIRMGPPISEKAPFPGAFFSALDKMFQEQVMKLAMIVRGIHPARLTNCAGIWRHGITWDAWSGIESG